MEVDRDLDKTRYFTLGSGQTHEAKPGEDLVYDKKTGYQIRNVVGGGRSAGRGGATAEEMRAYYAKKRSADKPPAGVKADLDAMKQEKANEAGMKSHEGRRLAKGGMAKGYAKGGSVKGSGCEQRGLRKCKVV
jgi:hypothetical protein